MNMRPSFQFYPADFRKDSALQSCSIGCRGLWIDLLCIMHECVPYGSLKINGKPLQLPQISRLVGENEDIVSILLKELEDAGVFSRDEDGTIYSRRMRKDEHIRTIRADAGRLGGNPNLVNQKPNQEVNLPVKQKLTPSSSSSSSSSKNIYTPEYLGCFDILKSIPSYPFDPQKDFELLQDKQKEFPEIDAAALLRDWKLYIFDHPFKKKSSPRSQLNKQFSLSKQWNKHQKTAEIAAPSGENMVERILAAEKEREETTFELSS